MNRVENRQLQLLERLFALPPRQVDLVLSDCADLIGEATGAEKVDGFLHDPTNNSLVAIGTTRTELAQLQKTLGLDRLPIANGDPMVVVFQTGEPYHEGNIDRDPRHPRGVIEQLGIRSMLAVAIDVGGVRRGVLSLASRERQKFDQHDFALVNIVGRWVGGLVHRSELMETFALRASEQARRETAEELITVLAHDLRNLLTPIASRLYMLSERASQADRRDDVADFKRVLSGVKRVSELMSDLLDVARVERGVLALTTTSFDIVQLVRASAEALALPEVEIDVESFAPELTVTADARRLRQAIENVLSNATKHSPRGVPVVVQIAPTKNEAGGSVVQISITDRGPGIAPDLVPRIFDRYVSSGRSAGLGLGLYLARAVLSAHGGSISVRSSATGTCCDITLPTGGEPDVRSDA